MVDRRSAYYRTKEPGYSVWNARVASFTYAAQFGCNKQRLNDCTDGKIGDRQVSNDNITYLIPQTPFAKNNENQKAVEKNVEWKHY